jgi:hypothetical protein
MRTYLITYDVAQPSRHAISGAIMSLGEAWARPLETTWYVQSPDRAAAIENKLRDLIEGEDGLLIQQVDSDAMMLNTSLRWFRKRRNVDADANVVAFPTQQASLLEAQAA